MNNTVEVDREALRTVLTAITSEDRGDVRKLQDTMNLLNTDNPVGKLIRDFNASVAYKTIIGGLFGGEEC